MEKDKRSGREGRSLSGSEKRETRCVACWHDTCENMRKAIKELNPKVNLYTMNEEFLVHYAEGKERIMILDLGAPLSLAGHEWIQRYLREYGMYVVDFKAVECYQI